MALRRRPDEFQGELWVATGSIAKAPGHVFYERLNALLREAGFDRFVEDLVAPYYASGGRPGIAPGVYFRYAPGQLHANRLSSVGVRTCGVRRWSSGAPGASAATCGKGKYFFG